MLARQKAMLATLVICGLIIALTTVAYILAAERVGREQLAPEISRTFADLLQAQVMQNEIKDVAKERKNEEVQLHKLQSLMHRMTQHYQVSEMALYNTEGQRVAHSFSQNETSLLSTNLTATSSKKTIHRYQLRVAEQPMSLLISTQVSLPNFFYLDTLTTALLVVTMSALLVFFLYALTRNWQRTPYQNLLHDIRTATRNDNDERITISTQDPDIKPLAEALNDLFWLRNQRTQHLKTAHQQAERARLRATRLSTETRQMNEDLAREVSVRRGIEVQLKNTKTLLNGILNAMPSALFALDARNRIVQCNQQAGDWLNKEYTQLVGLPLLTLVPELANQNILPSSPAVAARMEKIERLTIQSFERPMVTDVLAYPLPYGQQARVVIRIDDVSQRQRMEEIMVQTEKMMTVGGLAAGMAHEINNPLGAILQNLQNIRRRLQHNLVANQKVATKVGLPLDKLEEYLEQRAIYQFFDHIQDAGERAAQIVANMLQFARNDHLQKRPVDVQELIDTTLTIASNDLSLRHIDVELDNTTTIPQVICVPSEIEQVLLNLLKNSQQALESYEPDPAVEPKWRPRVRIRASWDDERICITIEDNGPGIPSDVVAHIFEPFYTTKEVGQGTGLGLSVSYFIVTSHHQGQLRYRPMTDGHGACFELCLPHNDGPHRLLL
ncbi:MAG: hypothetical protein COB43_13730 [Oceanospirillales bacterium]|nr:MAG: hypothetical protein COB43_13730 [Oceanospirillales bacterium]